MMSAYLALAIFAATLSPAATMAAEPAVAAAPAVYSTTATEIGTLLDDPASKAVLDQVLPGFSTNPQVEMARGMTLKSIQSYAADQLTDEKLAKVDVELAKLPVKK